jgi:hypothetical protein
MLNIYRVSIQLCRDCAPVIELIERHDRNLADQLRRAVTSVALNLAEPTVRLAGFGNSVDSPRSGPPACLEIGSALSYVEPPSPEVHGRLNHVIGGLVRLTR